MYFTQAFYFEGIHVRTYFMGFRLAEENSEKQVKLVTYDEKYLKDEMQNG